MKTLPILIIISILTLFLATLIPPTTSAHKDPAIWVPGKIVRVEGHRIYLEIKCWNGKRNYHKTLPFKSYTLNLRPEHILNSKPRKYRINIPIMQIPIWVPGKVISVKSDQVLLKIQSSSRRKNDTVHLFRPADIPGLKIERVITPKGTKEKYCCTQDQKYRIKDMEKLRRRR